MAGRGARLYSGLVFGRPWLVVVVAGFAWFAQYFRLHASADSLLLEDDPDLTYFREIQNRYGMREIVYVAYIPHSELFTPEELGKLEQLRQELLAIGRAQRIDSILNVPIFGDTPLTGVSENYQTLLDADIDLAAAGLQINLATDETARGLVGLTGSFTLLPQLLATFKPLGSKSA